MPTECIASGAKRAFQQLQVSLGDITHIHPLVARRQHGHCIFQVGSKADVWLGEGRVLGPNHAGGIGNVYGGSLLLQLTYEYF